MEKIHNCSIVLLGGLFGSGKTEFALKHFKNRSRYRVSRSEIRKLIYEMTSFGNKWTPDKFTEEDDVLVKHVERKMMEHYLHNKRNILVVNTFISAESRSRFIKVARELKKTIGMVFLDTPVDACLKNNEARGGEVPARIIHQLNIKKELPNAKEGFDALVIVKDFTIS